jgi:hypothetical protein
MQAQNRAMGVVDAHNGGVWRFADWHPFDEEQDPDADPHQSEKSDPIQHQSNKSDPPKVKRQDPYQGDADSDCLTGL